MHHNCVVNYCNKCLTLVNLNDKNRCVLCGNKKIRKPQNNDEIYLTTVKGAIAGMLEVTLKEAEIPLIKRPIWYSRTTAPFAESRFYIPFGAHEKAKELLTNLVGEKGENEKI